ncbi:uncharacterized protein LOC114300952 [Camellia sinensis]|uniref:uncharacterized protein LOC114300952 n=1 Tax=Camellia sinensis TaxID=4442 RepID=UPI001035FA25|nr:uncharacterized protein LOC114300952 [Camellia sinensis]
MDKSWIALGRMADGRMSKLSNDGVKLFLQFAIGVIDQNGNLLCPCIKCVNVYRQNLQNVEIHLLQYGIMQTYTIWHQHREPRVSNEAYRDDEMRVDGDEIVGGIEALVEDRIRGESTDTTQGEEVRTFDQLLTDAKRELFPNCTNYTLLKFVIEVLNMKVTNHWTNKSIDMMLEFLSRLLPKENLVPKSTYEAKKILRDLGLSYELIHACINDCVLFWKENATLDKCPTCKTSRYKISHGRGKKIPHKVLRYFPLTPRLKRLYMSRKRAEDMIWYKDKRVDDEILRHPADSDEWKEFDAQHPEFSLEPRNVRLGFAVDGFNPFGNMKNSYRLWPVILIPYNLPPWLVMKDPFCLMSLLILGESQPGIDIDVYMRPLVDELNDLWTNGALTYDASTNETFRMHAALFKIGYTNHRCYLPEDHPERRKSRAYNGKIEKRKRSLELPVEKIQHQLDNVAGVIYGKQPSNRKRPRQAPNWTKDTKAERTGEIRGRIINILCKLEKIFPPAFFDVIIHLAVHLPRKATLGGPVQYRWIYPIERFLGALKKYVTNRARPKGSIVEAYIVKECITCCSIYVDGIETVHNRPERNENRGERQQGLTVFKETARPIGLITRDAEMSQEIRDIAHWFVLYSSVEIEKYLEYVFH